jgi:hypothetical protein
MGLSCPFKKGRLDLNAKANPAAIGWADLKQDSEAFPIAHTDLWPELC